MHLERAQKLVIATGNAGKLREFSELFAPYDITAVSAGELGLADVDETGSTFCENALIKAHAAAVASQMPALADDSGLAVDALDGAPGIYSARWAGPDGDFALAMRNIEEALQAAGATTPGARAAHFACCLCLCAPDGSHELFEGRSDGALVWPPRGTSGFGYDPVFQPDGKTRTFGEMSADEKHALSHRARALKALTASLFERS